MKQLPEEYMSVLFSADVELFITSSMSILFVAFIIKLFFEDSSFEYLKIMSSIIALAITLYISTEIYKVEQISKIEDNIKLIKSYKLDKQEEVRYIDNANKNKKYLEDIDILGTVLGLAKILLMGVLIILIRDTVPKIIRNIKSVFLNKKDNKTLERNSLP